MLGYDIDPRGRRLTINADEALQVRTIFKLYLDYNALVPVVREIHRRGWRTKQWVTRKGVTHGGKPFTKGRLFRLLTNPIYIGKIDFEKQIYEGEHEAIVEDAIWGRVQQILQRNGRNGGVEVRDGYGALLKALLRCASCNVGMVPNLHDEQLAPFSSVRLPPGASERATQDRLRSRDQSGSGKADQQDWLGPAHRGTHYDQGRAAAANQHRGPDS